MTRFINASDTIVPDAVTGRLGTGEADHVTRIDGFNDIRVVTRQSPDPARVAVISGGGSGHEPAHAGFVGAGMLTAAAAGDVFASPTVDAVLAAILAVTGEGGCLLIIKNYTGDRLNFGLAAERAKHRGLDVEIVIVADDIALDQDIDPRGLAGTLFAHKVAGYHADRDAPLATVKHHVQTALARTASIGVALSSCDPLTQPLSGQPAQPEIGLGIHGEPGAERLDLDGAQGAIDAVVERLTPYVDTDAPLALLLNNLGGVSPIEMDILERDLLATELGQRARWLVGPAVLMSSLNMSGFSLSVLALTDELEQALTAEVSPTAWSPAKRVGTTKPKPMPDLGKGHTPAAESEPATEQRLQAVIETLTANRAELNALDAHVGDGDAGTTFATGARAVAQTLNDTGLPLASPGPLLAMLGRLAEQHMGGSSGVLLAMLLTTAGNEVGKGKSVVGALQCGVEFMQSCSGAKPGDRTLIDALVPGLETLAHSNDLAAAAQAARDGAAQTQHMAAGVGRSAYLRTESLAGHPDPGAIAVALVFEAVAGAR
ncbi:dihydroxyacetone kinase subunit DhaK [Salinisphaera orenii]|uniref:dihydroxyacetone kinase subunit DhaK n=1 Tax=Salinisphaera orenii TaxID=856731 RepID=UPI000DBE2A64